jgi:hypothetical protein
MLVLAMASPSRCSAFRLNSHDVGVHGEYLVQGLRMKNACEELAHVLVVPSGYFSSSAQAVP